MKLSTAVWLTLFYDSVKETTRRNLFTFGSRVSYSRRIIGLNSSGTRRWCCCFGSPSETSRWSSNTAKIPPRLKIDGKKNRDHEVNYRITSLIGRDILSPSLRLFRIKSAAEFSSNSAARHNNRRINSDTIFHVIMIFHFTANLFIVIADIWWPQSSFVWVEERWNNSDVLSQNFSILWKF